MALGLGLGRVAVGGGATRGGSFRFGGSGDIIGRVAQVMLDDGGQKTHPVIQSPDARAHLLASCGLERPYTPYTVHWLQLTQNTACSMLWKLGEEQIPIRRKITMALAMLIV